MEFFAQKSRKEVSGEETPGENGGFGCGGLGHPRTNGLWSGTHNHGTSRLTQDLGRLPVFVRTGRQDTD